MTTLHRLPLGVLTEFEIRITDILQLQNALVLFKRQTQIKKLRLISGFGDYTFSGFIFDDLKLESFDFLYLNRFTFDIARMLSKQRKLKSLTLTDAEVEEKSMNFVASQFTELETFSLDIRKSPFVASLVNVSNLKKLKTLSVSLYDKSIDELASFVKLRNTKITALTLGYHNLELDLIHDLAKSVENLKFLKFDRLTDPLQVSAILKNFNFVEVLEIRLCLEIEISPNLTLVELIINYRDSRSMDIQFLDQLTSCYPNLKKLKINFEWITSEQLSRILKGFTKLESLTLWGCRNLTISDLHYLMCHKTNLKFVCLEQMNVIVILTEKLKRQLSASFGAVSYDSDGTLWMAVNRRAFCKFSY